MDLIKYDNYDEISDNVRRMCAQRYAELEQALRPHINGEYGEIQAGHAQAYITCLKELGRLYQVHKPPRQDDDAVPAAEVERLLAAAEARLELAVAQAVAETEDRIRLQLEAARGVEVEAAKAAVLARINAVRR